jgi:hypothetical protein
VTPTEDFAAAQLEPGALPGWREMTGYHWWVVLVATLGWFFDSIEQRLFVVARHSGLRDLLASGDDAVIVGWRPRLLVGVLPSLLVVLVRFGLREPEPWLRAKAAALKKWARAAQTTAADDGSRSPKSGAESY